MLEFTIETALEGNIDTIDHCLYLYRDGSTVFYVGRSTSPLQRLHEHLGRGDFCNLPSPLGKTILDNLPLSLSRPGIRMVRGNSRLKRDLSEPILARIYFTYQVLHLQTIGDSGCHPERSEGSSSPDAEILRCAQDDSQDTSQVRSPEVLSPHICILLQNA